MNDILHTITVDGDDYTFTWSKDMTLLDALLAADIPAHYSCMDGHCGTSQCTLTGGKSHMLKNDVLSRYDIEKEGQVLACQAMRDGEGPYHCSFDE